MKERIFINQSKYTKDLLKHFDIDNSSSKRTPMRSTTMLDKNENDKSVDQKLYRGMIDSLLYITASRLDIIFSVYLCAKYQSTLKNHILKQ